jgi:hypothetical protein
MPKDRRRRKRLAKDVRMLIERSSSHPVEYAITLIARREGVWHSVRVFDNAHQPEEHHEHIYIGGEKQPPIVTHGPVNEAMRAAEIKLVRGFSDIVDAWDASR